jgi:hypothetical protein
MSGIPFWLNILISALAAVLGIFVGIRAHRREPISNASKVLNHSPHLWFVLVSPLLLLVFHATFHFNPELEWSLPYAAQYYYGPFSWSVIIACFTYFCGFGSAVFVTSNHPKRWHLSASMVMLFVLLQQYHVRATAIIPAVPREMRVEQGGFVRQSTRSTCVAAAAATALNLMGDPRDEAEMIRLLGTDYEGTSPSQLVMAMRRLGYRQHTVDVDREGLDGLKAPAVIFLKDNIHAMTLVKTGRDGALIWDPDRGKFGYDWARLRVVLAGAHVIHFFRPE